MNFATRILNFQADLSMDSVRLPRGVRVMNPFAEDFGSEIRRVTKTFYEKYYSDGEPRYAIVGINPGRFGAGVTGLPFTDTKRLNDVCGIRVDHAETHEPSSVFVYDVVRAYGGPDSFFRRFFITALCPLGFVKMNPRGREVNYNYYDDPLLQEAVTPFMVHSFRRQLEFGCHRDVCFCLGSGKNFRFFRDLNARERFVGEIVPLEHPRFIMQYRLKRKRQYIQKYLRTLGKWTGGGK